jgi:uncharacterized membrane protein (UPF0127 family)
MKTLSFVNQSKATVIGDTIAVADSFLTRFLGLMGKRSLAAGSGLWITPSSGVHTCWMCIPIDVVALDRNLRVVKICHAVRPWRLSGLSFRTRSVIELASGQIRACGLEVGDLLEIVPSPVLNGE